MTTRTVASIALSTETTPRKPYHTPRMDDYGAVNELTQASFNFRLGFDDGVSKRGYAAILS